MPASAELAPRVRPIQRASDREHLRLLEAFGGEYRAPVARAALDDIVQKLATASDGQIGSYEITILNSPVVNAFALPTGRLYVTRGLLALANDSSEIASVLAHEIAHVTAQHAVERAEREAESVLVSQVVSQVLNDPVAGAAVQAGSKLSLAKFSRQQELAADQISVQNIARAGFASAGTKNGNLHDLRRRDTRKLPADTRLANATYWVTACGVCWAAAACCCCCCSYIAWKLISARWTGGKPPRWIMSATLPRRYG